MLLTTSAAVPNGDEKKSDDFHKNIFGILIATIVWDFVGFGYNFKIGIEFWKIWDRDS